MATDVILGVAYGPQCDQLTYHAFLESYRRIKRPGLKLVLFAGALSEAATGLTRSHADEVITPPARFDDPGNKQRWWYYAQYLYQHLDLGAVLTVDTRDTVFQRDPTEFVPKDKEATLLFSAESGLVEADEWNRMDANRFQREIRHDCRSSTSNWPVINGGFMAGLAKTLATACLLRFALDARTGRGTDQASVTALAQWAQGVVPGWSIVTDAEPWIFHGHWYGKSKSATVDLRDGIARCIPAGGEPYCILHQFDRLPVKDLILKRYLGG